MKTLVGILVAFWLTPAWADGPVDDPIGDYQARCVGKEPTLDCEITYGRVRAAVILAFDDLVRAKDIRAIPVAVSAVALDDPSIQRAAMRVLRRWPRRPEVAPAVAPILLGDHPVLRHQAADILDKSAGDWARLGHQYLDTHPTVTTPDPGITAWDVDVLPDLAKLGFTPYAGWTRYPVADGRSGALGYATRDPPETVVAFYEKKTGTKAMDGKAVEAMKSGAATGDGMRNDAAEMQRLIMEFQKTHDPATMEKIKALGKGFQGKAATAQQSATAAPLPPPPSGIPPESLRAIVAEKHGDRPAKVIYVYREEAVGKTVIELVWAEAAPTK